MSPTSKATPTKETTNVVTNGSVSNKVPHEEPRARDLSLDPQQDPKGEPKEDKKTERKREQVRFLVRGLPWRLRRKELSTAAKTAGINAGFDVGNRYSRWHRTGFVVTNTIEDNEKAQKFLRDWYNKNRSEYEQRELGSGETQPSLTFLRLAERPSNTLNGKNSAKGKNASNAKNKSQQQPKRDIKDGSRVKVKLPRPDALYVEIPAQTSVDTLKAMLPGIPNFDVKLRRNHGNKAKAMGAVVTVGAEYQQKAIDLLAGKELNGYKLEPVPSMKNKLVKRGETPE